MKRFVVALFCLGIAATALFAATPADTEVKNVIQKFHEALDRHDVAAIGAIVSPDLVVLENGHRNDGWTDFRDNHLIPEFKEPPEPSKWEFVKVVVNTDMAWGYTKQTIDTTTKTGKHVGYRVWSVYVLQKTDSAWKVVLLDWSVGKINDAH